MKLVLGICVVCDQYSYASGSLTDLIDALKPDLLISLILKKYVSVVYIYILFDAVTYYVAKPLTERDKESLLQVPSTIRTT